jgi:hypothetical protein
MNYKHDISRCEIKCYAPVNGGSISIIKTPWKDMEEISKGCKGAFVMKDGEDSFTYGFGSGAFCGGLDKEVRLTPASEEEYQNYLDMAKMRRFVSAYDCYFSDGPLLRLHAKLQSIMQEHYPKDKTYPESEAAQVRDMVHKIGSTLDRNVGKNVEGYEFYTDRDKKLFLDVHEKVMG